MQEASRQPTAELDGIFPGSWIDANFYIWIVIATTSSRGASWPKHGPPSDAKRRGGGGGARP